ESIDETTSRDDALREFIAAVRTAARESDAAVEAAKPALARLAAAVVGHDNGQALRIRSILLSLYTGGSALADVSDLMALDWPLRKDLCAVLLAFGHGEFDYNYLKSAFELAGDPNAQWFLGRAHDPRERLEEALAFAKPGPLNTPRTLSEKGVAMFLLSLFAGMPADLQLVLRGLDRVPAELVVGVLTDYLAQRFDFTDENRVREHFELPT
ncbi:MAG TPA: hypothetical protein VFT72_19120, partial [Opitutaceae bacterium]|nr:hypothetical protein [Opitutaceae bacterium]